MTKCVFFPKIPVSFGNVKTIEIFRGSPRTGSLCCGYYRGSSSLEQIDRKTQAHYLRRAVATVNLLLCMILVPSNYPKDLNSVASFNAVQPFL